MSWIYYRLYNYIGGIIMKLVKSLIGIWASRCSFCGCSEMDCWGRCKRCGADMHK